MAKLEVESPEWWIDRLYKQIVARQPTIERLHAYYHGEHPLPWLPPQVRDTALRILKMTRSNYMGLVVDSTTERQEVLGFRIEDGTNTGPGVAPEVDDEDPNADVSGADAEAYRIWQANQLDATSSEAFQEAAISGTSYWLVSPNPKDPRTPRVTIEHPSQMTVEYAPGDMRQRDAAMKMWFDDRTGMVMATLYLPDRIYKYQGRKDSKPAKWEERRVAGEAWPVTNPYGVVPVIEMRNNAQTVFANGTLSYVGVSEIDDVTDIQDRINKTIADRLVTQDFGAFPQKWAKNWAEDDDDPDEQAALAAYAPGQVPNTHPSAKVNLGRDRMVVATGDVTFGEWGTAPMDPYSNAKNEDVKDIASRTRTPSQYLLGEMINISGEALQSAESGLVSKVKQRCRGFGESLEDLVRLFLLAAGDKRDLSQVTMSTIWREPQFRTIGQMADAAIKKHLAGLTSWDQTMEDLGYTPAQIRRNRRQKRSDALQGAALNFDGLFNSPKLGNATPSNAVQSTAGAPANPGDAAGVRARGDTAGQTAKAPATAAA